jgi:hypothetical protein
MEEIKEPIEGPAYNPFQHPLVWCLQDFLAQRNSSCSGDVSLLADYSVLVLHVVWKTSLKPSLRSAGGLGGGCCQFGGQLCLQPAACCCTEGVRALHAAAIENMIASSLICPGADCATQSTAAFVAAHMFLGCSCRHVRSLCCSCSCSTA